MPKETFHWQQFIYWHQFWHSWKLKPLIQHCLGDQKVNPAAEADTVLLVQRYLALPENKTQDKTLTAGCRSGLRWHRCSPSELSESCPDFHRSPTSAAEPAGCSVWRWDKRPRGTRGDDILCVWGVVELTLPLRCRRVCGYCQDGCFWSIWWGTDKTFLRVHIAHH